MPSIRCGCFWLRYSSSSCRRDSRWRIETLTILDGGDGNGWPNYVENLTNSAVVMLEQIKNATGIDVARLAKRAESHGQALPKELD